MRRVFTAIFKRFKKDGDAASLHHLTRLVQRYTVEQQQVPKDLNQLVALKYLDGVPTPPEGRKFIIDRTTVQVRLD